MVTLSPPTKLMVGCFDTTTFAVPDVHVVFNGLCLITMHALMLWQEKQNLI